MKFQKKVGIIVLCCSIVVLALCASSCGSLSTAPKTFWEQLGIEKEAVEEVRFTYRDQTIVLDNYATTEFLESITLSEPAVIEENHEFTPSDIGVTFVAEGKEYPVTFYWFPYWAKPEGTGPGPSMGWGSTTSELLESDPAPELIGNRFDVLIGDTLYHYRFTTEKVWTEEAMHSTYDRIASVKQLKTRAKIDGGSSSYVQAGFFTYDRYELEEILSESHTILLATYEGIMCENEDKGGYFEEWYMNRFHIDEVLKGEMEESWYYLPTLFRGDAFRYDGKIKIKYLPVYSPDFEKHSQYLICIGAHEYGNDKYFGQYGTAVLDGDTLFPRFNTEDHPFYNVKLQEIRDLLAKQN